MGRDRLIEMLRPFVWTSFPVEGSRLQAAAVSIVVVFRFLAGGGGGFVTLDVRVFLRLTLCVWDLALRATPAVTPAAGGEQVVVCGSLATAGTSKASRKKKPNWRFSQWPAATTKRTQINCLSSTPCEYFALFDSFVAWCSFIYLLRSNCFRISHALRKYSHLCGGGGYHGIGI